MTKPYLVPFKAEHMLEFVNRDTNERAVFSGALARERGGPAFTGFVGDKILGCAGVMLMWPGVGMAWVAVDKDITQHGRWLTRTVRRALSDIVRAYNLHRVEAVVLADSYTNVDWIMSLGFKVEENGFARKYTTEGDDVTRFELIK